MFVGFKVFVFLATGIGSLFSHRCVAFRSSANLWASFFNGLYVFNTLIIFN